MGGGLQERFGGMRQCFDAARDRFSKESLGEKNVAFVFDGHGAQFEGMGKELFEQYDDIRNICARANEAVGYDLTEIMFTNPDGVLNQTRYAQPAIVLYNEMCRQVFLKEYPGLVNTSKPVVTGQSLGFLNACYAAGVFRSEDGLDDGFTALMRLADTRGQLFQIVCDGEETGLMMVRTRNGDTAMLQKTIGILTGGGEASPFGIYPAITTSDTQVVVGGRKENLAAVQEFITALGDKQMQAIVLQASSGAFHTPLMEDALEPLEEYLDTIPLQDALVPLLTNSEPYPRPIRYALEIKEELLRLTTEPVYWKAVIDTLAKEGIETIYEFGDKGVGVRSLRDNRFPSIKTIAAGIAAVAGAAAAGAVVAYAIHRYKEEHKQ